MANSREAEGPCSVLKMACMVFVTAIGCYLSYDFCFRNNNIHSTNRFVQHHQNRSAIKSSFPQGTKYGQNYNDCDVVVCDLAWVNHTFLKLKSMMRRKQKQTVFISRNLKRHVKFLRNSRAMLLMSPPFNGGGVNSMGRCLQTNQAIREHRAQMGVGGYCY